MSPHLLTQFELDALGVSLKVAALSVLWALPVATLLAALLARPKLFGRPVLQALVYLPLVLPPVVTGYLLLLALGRNTAVGRWLESMGMPLAFELSGAALAAGIMALPLMVRAVQLSIEAIERHVYDTALTLGAGSIQRFFRLTLPLSLPGLCVAAMIGFARSVGEFGATMIFASSIPGKTQTLSTAIYQQLQDPDAEALAIRMVGISIALAVVLLAATEALTRWLNKQILR